MENESMKVYIIYDRYERDEWFSIDYVGTDRNESIKKFKEECLPDFISYGPDDCHSYQLQEVEMTQEQYDTFTKWIKEGQSLENYGRESSDLFKFMVNLYDETGVVGNTSVLLSTDGCSDYIDMIHFYGKSKGLDTEDDEVFEELQEELYNDEELYQKVLKKYIKKYYR
jgi:hypothetical protein